MVSRLLLKVAIQEISFSLRPNSFFCICRITTPGVGLKKLHHFKSYCLTYILRSKVLNQFEILVEELVFKSIKLFYLIFYIVEMIRFGFLKEPRRVDFF